MSAFPLTSGIDPAKLAALTWRITPAAMAAQLTRCEQPYAKFQWPRHVNMISLKVADAVAGRSPFVIINTPPQHGKSSLLSKWTPVWLMENWPHQRIILASYSGEFSEKWGRAVRDTITQYDKLLTVRLSASTTSAGEWDTTKGGGMVSVGVGGATTGRNADGAIIIDDPHKDAKEANSQAMRENVWDWFVSVILTRRSPKAPIFIIQTRWHPDDLTGRIKAKMAADPDFPKFEVINLPALAEDNDPLGRARGEALWPERYNKEWLEQQKKLVGSYWWSALYQGRPTSAEGNDFKRNWIDIVSRKDLPKAMKTVRFWDLAGTVAGEKGNYDPDYTLGMKMGVASAGVFFVLDVIRVRYSADKVERLVQQTARQDGPQCRIRMEQDPGQAGKDQVRMYQRLLNGYDFRAKPRTIDKVLASRPVAAACERGDVKFVEAPWNEVCMEELLGFPNTKHDDVIDGMVGCFADLTGTAQGWDAETLKRAFSYKGAPKEKQNILARLGYRTPESVN